MGKHKRHGTWKGKNAKSKKQDNPQGAYEIRTFKTENKYFDAYYRFQLKKEFASEAEFAEFKAINKEKLPVVFRINENVPNFQNFLQKLKSATYMEKLLTGSPTKENPEKVEGKDVVEETKEGEGKSALEQLKLKNISWYPRELVWQLNTFRQELKKNKAYQNLHKLIHDATEAGLISRQELVSMLPPLLLDIQSTDLIFDMCAAPGSKTAQMLEIMSRDEALGKGMTKGGVIANDISYDRASMLIHQVQRMSTAGMMVVNHSAQHFPTMRYSLDSDPSVYRDPDNRFYFDKVLADVPCTGDGAIRKLPMKWAKWSLRDGLTLHPLQLLILIRAIQITKPGGLILYSTCSINPIEDEAVIAEIFRRCENDSIELVDIREKVPGLVSRPGLAEWSVCEEREVVNTSDTEGKEKVTQEENKENSEKEVTAEGCFNIYKSYSEIPEGYKGMIQASMFPESVEKMRDVIKIQNSVRIMPHDQNTGGFYLALIRKKGHTVFNTKGMIQTKEGVGENVDGEETVAVAKEEEKVEKEIEEVAETKVANEDNNVKEEGKEDNKEKEEEGEESEEGDNEKGDQKEGEVTEKKDEGEKEIKPQTGKRRRRREEKKKLTFDKFEPEEWDWIKSYYGINDDGLKDLLVQTGDRKIYMISPGIRKLLDLEKGVLNKLNMGARALFRNREVFLDDKYPYRICQDAVQTLFPVLTKRKIKCSASDFVYLVEKLNVRFHELPSEELKQRVKEEGQGCFVIYAEKDGPIQETDCLVCLCHGASVSLMVSRELIQSMKLRYMDNVL